MAMDLILCIVEKKHGLVSKVGKTVMKLFRINHVSSPDGASAKWTRLCWSRLSVKQVPGRGRIQSFAAGERRDEKERVDRRSLAMWSLVPLLTTHTKLDIIQQQEGDRLSCKRSRARHMTNRAAGALAIILRQQRNGKKS